MRKFKIGYVRVSSPYQDPTRQILNIKAKCPDAVIVQEKFTGTTMSRPMWNKIMASAEGGHISDIYFDEPSRMGRTADECFKCYKHLYFDLKISLHFMKSSHVDTKIYEDALKSCMMDTNIKSGDEAADKMIQTILSAVHEYMFEMIENQIKYAFKKAEDEAAMLSERTKSGLALAKKRGKQIGGSKGEHFRSKIEWRSMPLIIKYYKGFCGDYDIAKVAKICGITYETTRKYIANIYKEQEIKNEAFEKYADKKPWTMIIKDTDIYREESDKIWQKKYGKLMKWFLPAKKKRSTAIAGSPQQNSEVTDRRMRY